MFHFSTTFGILTAEVIFKAKFVCDRKMEVSCADVLSSFTCSESTFTSIYQICCIMRGLLENMLGNYFSDSQ